MFLQVINPATKATISRHTIHAVGEAAKFIGNNYAAILTGDPCKEREVECIAAYDGKWHKVG